METDTIIKAFGQRFKIVCLENAGKDAENDDVLTITNLKTKKIIVQDSLNLNYNLRFERKDYNKDGVKDIQLYSYSGARSANSMYYLYISDVPNKTFDFVTDFDEEPSPEADSSGMVIYHAYYGDTEDHRFYKIMPNYCMEDIGYNVEMHFGYADTPQEVKQEKQNEKAYRKAYNKAWAKFKKMK